MTNNNNRRCIFLEKRTACITLLVYSKRSP
jgi:hypothetical protein